MFDWQKKIATYLGGEINSIFEENSLRGSGLDPSNIHAPLQYYQNSHKESLLEVLRERFSKTKNLLGEPAFTKLCQTYVRNYPSTTYSLDHYGRDFPQTLEDPNIQSFAQFECMYEDFIFEVPNQRFSEVDYSKSIIGVNFKLWKSKVDLLALWNSEESPNLKTSTGHYHYVLYYDGLSENIHFDEIKLWQYQFLFASHKPQPLESLIAQTKIEDEEENITGFFKFLGDNHLVANQAATGHLCS